MRPIRAVLPGVFARFKLGRQRVFDVAQLRRLFELLGADGFLFIGVRFLIFSSSSRKSGGAGDFADTLFGGGFVN